MQDWMCRYLYALFFTGCSICFTYKSSAQEFPVEYIAHTHLASGVQTKFNNSPDLFYADLRFVPQYTIIRNKMRGGVVAGVLFTEKKVGALAGPTLSLLLVPFRVKLSNEVEAGTIGNLHLNVQHLWATDGRHLAGGGLGIDLGNRIVLGLQSYRDYKKGNWSFLSSIGFRTSKVKTPVETFPH